MSDFFLSLLSMSLTASYSIFAVLIIRLLLCRAPKKYSYLLWSVVAFRLCCPVSFSSAVSLLRPGLPGISPSVSIGPDAASSGAAALFSAALRNPAPSQTWLALASALWLAGAFALAAYGLISYIRLAGKLRTAIRLKGNVFQSEYVQSPFILGLAHPKIYIPFHLDDKTLHYVLLHENYHIKRSDHILKIFAYLLLSLHWFNPLCWLSFHLFSKDMEMSCDEHVLGRSEHTSGDYSATLFSFALRRSFPSPGPLAFGETDIRERILHILDWKRPRPAAAFLAALLCLGAIFVCAANPIAADPQTNEEDTSGIRSLPDMEESAEEGPDAESFVQDEPLSDPTEPYEAAENDAESFGTDNSTDAEAFDGDESYSDLDDPYEAAENEYMPENTDFSENTNWEEGHHTERHHSGHHME